MLKSLNKILIANRAEIACRIIKTAKKMGISTVAVYSNADRDSLHVKQADEAVFIGDAPAQSSYLNIPAIIEAATATHCDAIHPGYGFLSENTAFAKACAKAQITFIGPTVAAMQAMASKQLAKQLLEQTNVPLTPGYHGLEQDDETLLQQAKKIGFPVLLKAAAGGGGKGMRAVEKPQDFHQALAGARREAMASFADDTMIVEKLIVNPRHVEIQIMADAHGNAVHLFERDCSIQRRHQKIIEEAPAPGLSDELRHNLAQAAIETAKKINYLGAGTVEFLVDKSENFYFMEMNTRLQVEHPVTEMITGLDLVEWQIKIAANEPLPLQQKDIQHHGHAIECRIYAEDPQQDFMPSIGKIHCFHAPEGEGIRLDTGVEAGSEISMYYDPMIAKLICWGENRNAALLRLNAALKQFAVGGVKTNLAFLSAIVGNEAFHQAQLSTDFLQKHSIELAKANLELAFIMATAIEYSALRNSINPLLNKAFGWQMHLKSQWTMRCLVNNILHSASISPVDANGFLLTTAEMHEIPVKIINANNWLTVEIDGRQEKALVEKYQDKLYCYLDGHCIETVRYQFEDAGEETTGSKNQLTAPMPATVVAILKQIGDKVTAGERLIVLEAMKMEHTIHAPRNGTLKELFYGVGQQVQEGAELLALDD